MAFAAAEAAYDAGVPVLVMGMEMALGSPAYDFDEVMTGIALAGGTGAYYPIDDTSEIEGTIAEIFGDTLHCEFDVDWSTIEDGAQPWLVNVYYEDETIIGYNEGCASGDSGWEWVDDDTIGLCPDTCAEYKTGAICELNVTFGCSTVVIE
jgi:hypothetical protein